MKKKLIALFICLLVFPMVANASTATMGLMEVLTEEGIDTSSITYETSDNKPNVYLFRGKGCHNCHNLMSMLASIISEYGKYFNFVSYEIYNNKDNNNLMSKVSDFLGANADGVPFLIIGDDYFVGYGTSLDEQIKEKLKSYYESEDRYDVFEAMEKAENDSNNQLNKVYKNTITWMIIVNVVVLGAVFIKTTKDKKEILAKLNK